jgi:cytochrome-b5 reductase
MLSTLASRFAQRSILLYGGGSTAAIAGIWSLTGQPAELSLEPSAAPLDPNEWRPLKLIHKEKLTSGERPTHLLRFELPQSHPPLPVASCVLTRLPVGKEKEDGTRAFVIRPYTPVSAPNAPVLDLALKIYSDGKLTPHLVKLNVGDSLDVKGPMPKLPLSEAAKKSAIGLVAGGTGITPMLQLATELLKSGYKGQVSLIYANVSPSDVMLKGTVDELAANHKNFKVLYLVDKAEPSAGWKGGIGYVTAAHVKELMPHPGAGGLVAVCGPPGMMKVVSGEKVSPKDQGPLTGILKGAGYKEEEVYKF